MNVVITGASSGLGAALARRYAGPSAVLGLIGRDGGRLQEVTAACEALGAEVLSAQVDVADTQKVGDWIARFEASHPIDVIVANAGISSGPAPGAQSEGLGSIARQINTNLLGVVATVEAALPGMLSRRRGRIGIISSIAGLRGLPYSPGYSASKAGSRAYGEALRALVAPAGITVSVISPGFFGSPMTDRWKGPTPFLRTAERVADQVKACVDRGRARSAWPWPLVLGLHAADLAPAAITDAILRGFHFHIARPDGAA
jgi:NAD(P)-dependent dehydrogenase (short-subunit alcohol dehydrogenase family)